MKLTIQLVGMGVMTRQVGVELSAQPCFWVVRCYTPLLQASRFIRTRRNISFDDPFTEILVDVVDIVLIGSGIDEKFLGATLFALVPNVTEFMNAMSFALNGNISLRWVRTH